MCYENDTFHVLIFSITLYFAIISFVRMYYIFLILVRKNGFPSFFITENIFSIRRVPLHQYSTYSVRNNAWYSNIHENQYVNIKIISKRSFRKFFLLPHTKPRFCERIIFLNLVFLSMFLYFILFRDCCTIIRLQNTKFKQSINNPYPFSFGIWFFLIFGQFIQISFDYLRTRRFFVSRFLFLVLLMRIKRV